MIEGRFYIEDGDAVKVVIALDGADLEALKRHGGGAFNVHMDGGLPSIGQRLTNAVHDAMQVDYDDFEEEDLDDLVEVVEGMALIAEGIGLGDEHDHGEPMVSGRASGGHPPHLTEHGFAHAEAIVGTATGRIPAGEVGEVELPVDFESEMTRAMAEGETVVVASSDGDARIHGPEETLDILAPDGTSLPPAEDVGPAERHARAAREAADEAAGGEADVGG